MYEKGELRKALAKGDLCRASGIVQSAPSLSSDDVASLVREVIHSGSMIRKYNTASIAKGRNALLGALLRCIKQSEDPSAVLPLAEHISQSALLEEAYAGILDLLARCDIDRCTPAEQAWAAIRYTSELAKTAVDKMQAKVRNTPKGSLVVPSTTISEPGYPDADVDGVIDGAAIILWATLHMLAYREGWFRNGKLVIPPPVEVDDDLMVKSGSNAYLADTWGVLEDADEHLRYFGGTLEKKQLSREDAGAPDKSALLFGYSLGLRSHEHAARERLEQLVLGYGLVVQYSTPKNITISETAGALAPSEFVSRDELLTYEVLHDAYHLPVDDHTLIFGPLSLAEWLRGYAVLKVTYCGSDPNSPVLDTVRLSHSLLKSRLTSAGLSDKSARAFIEEATLSRGKRDLFDAPLIEDENGQLHLLTPVLFSVGLPLVVVSQIGRFDPPNRKGDTFEAAVLRLFDDKKIPAKGFEYTHEGRKYECDVAVLWNRHLFIFECKNHILPSAQASHRFTFWQNFEKDIRQTKRITDQLASLPDVISNVFGSGSCAEHVHGVLLNAMPFSIPGGVQSIYVYDYSALSRFFRDPFVTFTSPVVRKDGSRGLLEFEVDRLWKSGQPSPEDLLREMENPVQLVGFKWFADRLRRAVSDSLAIEVPILRREDLDFRDVLRARGADEEAIKKFERSAIQNLERFRAVSDE